MYQAIFEPGVGGRPRVLAKGTRQECEAAIRAYVKANSGITSEHCSYYIENVETGEAFGFV